MEFNGLPKDAYDRQAARDPKVLQQEICSWISELKRAKSSPTISSYVASLVKVTNINDIKGINWPIVHSFEPEKIRRNYFDRPYTREESNN